jgi:hypothetical protein
MLVDTTNFLLGLPFSFVGSGVGSNILCCMDGGRVEYKGETLEDRLDHPNFVPLL